MDNDIEYDDILDNLSKSKKKKNSKNKGKRGELLLCEILNKNFDTNKFSRVVGSGNRWSQVAYVTKDYIGDVVVPEGFKFCVECKFGYSINFYNILTGQKCKILDGFLKQATKDASASNRIPILCWKLDRNPWIAFLPQEEVSSDFDCYLKYKKWICVDLNTLLELDDTFFFE